MQEKVSIMGVWCGLKNLSLEITVRHHSASLVMPISDPRERFFCPHHTPMKDTYNTEIMLDCFFQSYGASLLAIWSTKIHVSVTPPLLFQGVLTNCPVIVSVA